jgi:tetratricopeptide (TPR) repeat protein
MPALGERSVRSPAISDGAGATIYPDPNQNSLASAGSLATVPPPQAGSPLAYSASRSETALQVEDLMRGAAALRTQGNFPKAMALCNDALTLAPNYAEGYRQRALTLVRLGDRVRAQVDYNRYLALDPHATAHAQDELVLFEQSGRRPPGQAEAASYSYGEPNVLEVSEGPLPINPLLRQMAETRFSAAVYAFQRGDFDAALRWAATSADDIPQARTRALTAQILFAQGDFRGAATEARAAVAMEPTMDWRTLYGYYNYATPRFTRQLHNLEEFVRENPSSADGHFMLGYERLVLGQTDAAHAQLAIAAVMEPADVVATNLLAKDGVEIVGSHRPLVQPTAQAMLPRQGVEVARRLPTLSVGIVPPPPPSGFSPPEAPNRSEVIR